MPRSIEDEYYRTLASFDQAEAQYEEIKNRLRIKWLSLEKLRKISLQHVLNEKGLDICCSPIHREEKNPEEDLGLFKASDMTMVRSTMEPSYDTHLRIYILCPSHINDKGQLGRRETRSNGSSTYTAFVTEVVRKKGKLIQKINNEDVTDLIVIRGSLTEEMYSHFGLPPLPKRPTY